MEKSVEHSCFKSLERSESSHAIQSFKAPSFDLRFQKYERTLRQATIKRTTLHYKNSLEIVEIGAILLLQKRDALAVVDHDIWAWRVSREISFFIVGLYTFQDKGKGVVLDSTTRRCSSERLCMSSHF